MKKIVLVGGGGHCKSVLDSILARNEYDEIVITDPNLPVGTTILGCPVVGNDLVLPELREKGFTDAFITLGSITNTNMRHNLARLIEEAGFSVPVIIDPSAIVSSSAIIERGTFVGKNTTINVEAKIGNHSIINTGAIIEHECTIGSFCHIAVGAVLCGNVSIGNDTFIGAGATVIQGIIVGKNVIVGANSTVLTDIDDNLKVVRFVTSRGSSK